MSPGLPALQLISVEARQGERRRDCTRGGRRRICSIRRMHAPGLVFRAYCAGVMHGMMLRLSSAHIQMSDGAARNEASQAHMYPNDPYPI